MANIQYKYLTYIVAFNYRNSYKEASNILKQVGFSIKEHFDGECDLYKHIKNEMYDKHTLGSIFDKQVNLNLLYGRDEKKTQITITEENIFLFNNGIGFLSYNIEAPEVVDSEQVKMFQNKYKELTYLSSVLLIDTNQTKDSKIVCKPFLLGQWIASQLEKLDIEFVPERNNIFKEFKTYDYYKPDDCIVEYDETLETPVTIPDKAILFTYLAFEDGYKASQEEMDDYAYHIGNGYKDSYLYSESIDYKPYHPFGNIVWSSSSEGCAIISYPDETNHKYFTQTLPKRMEATYLYLFIRVLFEKYSLLKYHDEISETISYNSQEFLDGSKYKETINILSKVNLFRTKVVATSVSHISHHMDFYSHLENYLHIEEISKKLAASLDSLNSLQESINERRMNYILAIISTIQAIAAIPDTFALFNIFCSFNDVNTITELFTKNIVAGSAFIALSLLMFIVPIFILIKIKRNMTN